MKTLHPCSRARLRPSGLLLPLEFYLVINNVPGVERPMSVLGAVTGIVLVPVSVLK